MSTLSWRKAGSSSALALSLVVGLPALAQAQLFPNMWIQRERTPCPNEPPFYAHVRHNYYGYFPTCWRKFPEGWACPCPNPEAPDAAASFNRQPRDPKPEPPPPENLDALPGGAPPEPGPGPGQPRGGAEMPPLPRGLNDNLGPPGGRDTGPMQPTPGRGNQPEPRDPFDPLRPAIPRSAGPGSSSLRIPPPATDGPALVPPAGETTGILPASGDDSLAVAGDPVLALPEMSRPDGPPVQDPTMPASLPPDATTVNAPPPSTTPAQAPRRPGLLSGLLNLGNRRRR